MGVISTESYGRQGIEKGRDDGGRVDGGERTTFAGFIYLQIAKKSSIELELKLETGSLWLNVF